MAGGIRSDYVLCEFPGGRSWDHSKPAGPKGAAKATTGGLVHPNTNKSPFAYVKEDVAKFFDISRPVPKDAGMMMMSEESERTYLVKDKKTGEMKQVKAKKRQLRSNMGSTGKGRSITIVFTTPQRIGDKTVASVRIPIPSAYTIGDVNEFITTRTNVNLIAKVISDKGKAMTYASTANKGGSTQKASPAARRG